MSEFRIVKEYPHSRAKVWRALTDPDLIPRWTSTGQGGRPVGFVAVPGTEFTFVAKPVFGWSGVVACKVLEAAEPSLLRYTWVGDEGDAPTTVTCRLEACERGTRLTWAHTGFTGVGGFAMAKLLGSVRRKMLDVGFPAVLDAMEDHGTLREGR